jgi:hypothetical protein
MEISHLRLGDVIMVSIDGNPVPCVVLSIELGTPGSLRLEDTGSGRAFWRSATELAACPRFSNTIVSHRCYSDYLKHNQPDVTVRWLQPAGSKRRSTEVTIHHPTAAAADTAALVEKARARMSPAEMLSLLQQLNEKARELQPPKAEIV